MRSLDVCLEVKEGVWAQAGKPRGGRCNRAADASLRFASSNFTSSHIKRIHPAWLQYCADDQLVSATLQTSLSPLNENSDAPGPTFFSYTPNGKKLVTAGLNGAIKIFEHGSDDEPTIIDVSTENHLAAVSANDFCIIGCETGEVTRYNLVTRKMDEILVRCAAPIRDLALSPDAQWVAVASEYGTSTPHYLKPG